MDVSESSGCILRGVLVCGVLARMDSVLGRMNGVLGWMCDVVGRIGAVLGRMGGVVVVMSGGVGASGRCSGVDEWRLGVEEQ